MHKYYTLPLIIGFIFTIIILSSLQANITGNSIIQGITDPVNRFVNSVEFSDNAIIGTIVIGAVLLLIFLFLLISYLDRTKVKKVKKRMDIPKTAPQHPAKKEPVKTMARSIPLKNLIVYAKKELKKGKKIEIIRKEMISLGATSAQRSEALAHARAEVYILSRLKKGLTKEQLIKELKAKGWTDKVIKRLFMDLKK